MGDGLAGPEVAAILQDRDGVLWFGTGYSGVSRYDGRNWTTLARRDGLAHNQVSAMLADEGKLWFGTGGGISCYDGSGFTTLTTRDGLVHDEVWCILRDRAGLFWFGTRGGVSRYDGERFTSFTDRDGLVDRGVRCMLQDHSGVLWFGTERGGVSRYDGRTWTAFTSADGLAAGEVRSALCDREGSLWFGTMGGGVSRFDGCAWTTFSSRDGLSDDHVRCVYQDPDGVLWLGTEGGVCRRDRDGWTSFTTRDGLADDHTNAILQDREGFLWVTTQAEVSRYDGESMVTFTSRDGLPHDIVISLLEDRDGALWFGTRGGGVARYDGEHFTTLATVDGLPHDQVRSICQARDGSLWFATYDGGVSRYDGRTWTILTAQDGLVNNHLRSLLQDRHGTWWFGTDGSGVCRYDGRQFTAFGPQDGLAGNRVWHGFEDRQGYLWFGTYTGLSRHDGTGWRTFTEGDGLPHPEVRSIMQDRQGRVWLGTPEGAAWFDGERFGALSTEDGLPYQEVRAVLEDRAGHFWFATYGGGVCHWDGQTFQTLNRLDGLAHNQVTSILQDRCGDLWFGTLGGVTRYRPRPPSPPLVTVQAMVADQRYDRPQEVAVPTGARVVTFAFRGVSLKTRPDGMIYQYRLLGHDADWRSTRTEQVEYQDLPAGEYTFQVRGVDRDLVYSEPAVVKLAMVRDPRIEALNAWFSASGMHAEFIGRSAALRRVQAQLEEVAGTDMTVLILGETGTGKGLAARAVHALSARRSELFLQVNCGALPEGLVENELFGHERGAFTGAVSRKLGKVELAAGGTLLLDEVGDLGPAAQAKLLELLEEATFARLGGTQVHRAQVRIIAVTNRDLGQLVATGQFRQDLYFRLSGFPVRMPPLRERREDIPLLATYFADRMAAHLNRPLAPLGPEVLVDLVGYTWPGNVRELEHVMQRAVILCPAGTIRREDIRVETERQPEDTADWMLPLEELERRHIREVLEHTGWTLKGPHGAAAILRLPESTLRGRMKKLGIVRSQDRHRAP